MKPYMGTIKNSKWTKTFAWKPVRLRCNKLVWLRSVYVRKRVAIGYIEPVVYKLEYDTEENIIMEVLTK